MKSQLVVLAVVLAILASLTSIITDRVHSTTPAQAEMPQRFVELANQFYPSVVLMQDTATGTCWITTQRAEAGWTQAPEEVCGIRP